MITGSYSSNFRSDSGTRPTPQMLEFMTNVELGVEHYGDDPSIHLLEKEVSNLFGKDDAIFLPSSSMGNLIGILCLCPKGTSFIVGKDSYMYGHTHDAYATIAGAEPIALDENADGTLNLSEVNSLLQETKETEIRAICLENTHNFKGGAVLPLQFLKEIKDTATKYGVAMHLDGARVLNAAVALDVHPTQITQYFDTVTLCLTKGLGCPVGGMLAGSKDFISQARIMKGRLGGVMAQGGLVAATGIYALRQDWRGQMKQDHERMKYIAEQIEQVGGGEVGEFVKIAQLKVESNLLFLALTDKVKLDGDDIRKRARETYSVDFGVLTPRILRAVTHLNTKDTNCEDLISALDSILKEQRVN